MEQNDELATLLELWPQVAKDILAPALDSLSVAHQVCSGDIELYLIMLAIVLRTVEHEDFAKIPAEDVLSGRLTRLPSLGTNVRSIAESLGMPKETVRRKVERLVETGWIERDGASLRFAARPPPGVACMREAILRAALKQHHVINRALAASPARRRQV